MLIDTHCHLGHQRFTDDLELILHRAREAGVTRYVAPAVDLVNARHLLHLHSRHPELHPAVGIHPCDVDSLSTENDDWVAELRSLATQPGVAAIGEIGLDFFHPPPDGFTSEAWRQHQVHALTLQLELAAELSQNVIIHTRESHAETLAVLQPFTGRLRAVFHCFTGSADQAAELRDLNHLVSFTGIVTFKNSPLIQDTATKVPDGSFMLETDSPYLAPVPHRGHRCEPAFVADTAHFVAKLRQASLEGLAATTSATAEAFFRL